MLPQRAREYGHYVFLLHLSEPQFHCEEHSKEVRGPPEVLVPTRAPCLRWPISDNSALPLQMHVYGRRLREGSREKSRFPVISHLIAAIVAGKMFGLLLWPPLWKHLYPLTQWVTACRYLLCAPAALVGTPKTRSRTRTIWLVASKEYLKAPSSALSPLSHKPYTEHLSVTPQAGSPLRYQYDHNLNFTRIFRL